MKRIILGSILILFTLHATSQVTNFQGMKELSITTNNLIGGEFDFKFRSGLNENLFLTLGLINLNASYRITKASSTFTYPRTDLNMKGGISIGLEKRRSISELFSFYYGFDLRASTIFTTTVRDDPNRSIDLRTTHSYTYTPGIGFSLGVMIKLSEQVFISTEVTPSLYYRVIVQEQANNLELSTFQETSINFDASSEVVRLGFVYRWE